MVFNLCSVPPNTLQGGQYFLRVDSLPTFTCSVRNLVSPHQEILAKTSTEMRQLPESEGACAESLRSDAPCRIQVITDGEASSERHRSSSQEPQRMLIRSLPQEQVESRCNYSCISCHPTYYSCLIHGCYQLAPRALYHPLHPCSVPPLHAPRFSVLAL